MAMEDPRALSSHGCHRCWRWRGIPTVSARVRVTTTQGSEDPDANIAAGTAYDRAGRVTATVDAKGIVTRSIFNDRGWVVRSIANCTDSGSTPSADPANCTGAGTHDGATNVVIDTTYDDAGHVLTSTLRDPSSSAHDVVTASTYDADGNMVEQVVDTGSGKLNLTTQYAYDDARAPDRRPRSGGHRQPLDL